MKVIAFASVMSGLVLFALVKTNQPTPAAVLLMILGAGLGVLTPVAWGVLQEVAPSHMLAVLALGWMATASAHHSNAAYDVDHLRTIEGTVKEVNWTNPHITFHDHGQDRATTIAPPHRKHAPPVRGRSS